MVACRSVSRANIGPSWVSFHSLNLQITHSFLKLNAAGRIGLERAHIIGGWNLLCAIFGVNVFSNYAESDKWLLLCCAFVDKSL